MTDEPAPFSVKSSIVQDTFAVIMTKEASAMAGNGGVSYVDNPSDTPSHGNAVTISPSARGTAGFGRRGASMKRRSSKTAGRRRSSALYRSFVLNSLDLGDSKDLSDEEIVLEGSFRRSIAVLHEQPCQRQPRFDACSSNPNQRVGMTTNSNGGRNRDEIDEYMLELEPDGEDDDDSMSTPSSPLGRCCSHRSIGTMPEESGKHEVDNKTNNYHFSRELQVAGDDSFRFDALMRSQKQSSRSSRGLLSQRSLRFRNNQSLSTYLRQSSLFRSFVLNGLDMTCPDESIVFGNSIASLELDFTENDEGGSENDDEELDSDDDYGLYGGSHSDTEVDYTLGTMNRLLTLLSKSSPVVADDNDDNAECISHTQDDDVNDDDNHNSYGTQGSSVALKVMESIRKANALILEKKKRREASKARQEHLDAWETSSQHSESSCREIDALVKSLFKDFVENKEGENENDDVDVKLSQEGSEGTIPYVGDVVEESSTVAVGDSKKERLGSQIVEMSSTGARQPALNESEHHDILPVLETTVSSTDDDAILTPLNRKENEIFDYKNAFTVNEGRHDPSPLSLNGLSFSPILKQGSDKNGEHDYKMGVPDIRESTNSTRGNPLIDAGVDTPGSKMDLKSDVQLMANEHSSSLPILGNNAFEAKKLMGPTSIWKRKLLVLIAALLLAVAVVAVRAHWILTIHIQVSWEQSERVLEAEDQTVRKAADSSRLHSETKRERTARPNSKRETALRKKDQDVRENGCSQQLEKEIQRCVSEKVTQQSAEVESVKFHKAGGPKLAGAEEEGSKLVTEKARYQAGLEAKRKAEEERKLYEGAQMKREAEQGRQNILDGARMDTSARRKFVEDHGRITASLDPAKRKADKEVAPLAEYAARQLRAERTKHKGQKLKQFFVRLGLRLHSLFLNSQLIAYRAAKRMGFEIMQLSSVAGQLAMNEAKIQLSYYNEMANLESLKRAQAMFGEAKAKTVQTFLSTAHVGADKLNQGLSRAGEFANDVSGSTMRAAQHVNDVVGDVASTQAKIYGASSNLAGWDGGQETLAYVGGVIGSAASHVKDIASDLAETNARIHRANYQQWGAHESVARIGRMVKERTMRIVSGGRR